MQPRPEPPGRPWWVVPLVGVLAFLGVVFLVRLIVGLLAGVFTIVAIVGVIVLGLYLFAIRNN
jgi:hypothetical protein